MRTCSCKKGDKGCHVCKIVDTKNPRYRTRTFTLKSTSDVLDFYRKLDKQHGRTNEYSR